MITNKIWNDQSLCLFEITLFDLKHSHVFESNTAISDGHSFI